MESETAATDSPLSDAHQSEETVTENVEAIDEQALKVQIELALAHNFRYPAMAKRRGWQGEVYLSFRLESDGRIHDAKVARSSGYVILDRAALATLEQIGTIAARLPSARQMELPVIYRLQEG